MKPDKIKPLNGRYKLIDPMKHPRMMDAAIIQIRPDVWISANQLGHIIDNILIDAICGKKYDVKAAKNKKGRVR